VSSIFFIRHGQASFGTGNYDRLSELGKKQAERLGAYLAEVGTDFDAVYTGSMQRQVQTAEIVTAGLGSCRPLPAAEVAAEFDEYDSEGVFKAVCPDLVEEDPDLAADLARILKDPSDFQRLFEEIVGRWVAGRYTRPVSETWPAFTRRVRHGLNRVMDDCGQGRQIAVFSSAGALSAVMQKALGLSDEQTVAVSWAVYNSAVSVFRYDSRGRFGLSTFNSVAHLEVCRDAALLTYR
jgi:broad specificity phosphatase PhoE